MIYSLMRSHSEEYNFLQINAKNTQNGELLPNCFFEYFVVDMLSFESEHLFINKSISSLKNVFKVLKSLFLILNKSEKFLFNASENHPLTSRNGPFGHLKLGWLRTCLSRDMKKLILFSILVLGLGFQSYSQQIAQFALTSGGGEFTSVYGENIQFTIGQAYVTNTLTDNNNTFLTQGYQQPSINQEVIAGPPHADLELVKLEAFPNPAVNFTDLVMNFIDNDGAKVTMSDMWGQPVKSQDFQVSVGKQKMRFTFGSLNPGVYNIKIVANKTVYVKKLLVAGAGTQTL
nr:T9SS type A sorting domain-containing protein [Pseudopedobacter sp.]